MNRLIGVLIAAAALMVGCAERNPVKPGPIDPPDDSIVVIDSSVIDSIIDTVIVVEDTIIVDWAKDSTYRMLFGAYLGDTFDDLKDRFGLVPPQLWIDNGYTNYWNGRYHTNIYVADSATRVAMEELWNDIYLSQLRMTFKDSILIRMEATGNRPRFWHPNYSQIDRMVEMYGEPIRSWFLEDPYIWCGSSYNNYVWQYNGTTVKGKARACPYPLHITIQTTDNYPNPFD